MHEQKKPLSYGFSNFIDDHAAPLSYFGCIGLILMTTVGGAYAEKQARDMVDLELKNTICERVSAEFSEAASNGTLYPFLEQVQQLEGASVTVSEEQPALMDNTQLQRFLVKYAFNAEDIDPKVLESEPLFFSRPSTTCTESMFVDSNPLAAP